MKATNKLEVKRVGIEKILFIIVFIIFVLYSLSLLFPLVWGFISSFKTAAEYFNKPFSLPAKIKFNNYSDALKHISIDDNSLLFMVWNSIWFSVGSTILTLFFTSLSSYIFAKYDFKGKNAVFTLVIFSFVIPLYGSFPAIYQLYHKLRLVDSYSILLTATGGFSMWFVILISYYKNVSWAYAEAAMIDGAGHFKTYFTVMMPQAAPMIASLFLLGFIGRWNDYMSPLLYLQKMPTLATGLFRYQTIVESTGRYPMLFAGLFISLIPIAILFALLSKTMMENMSFGGLKG